MFRKIGMLGLLAGMSVAVVGCGNMGGGLPGMGMMGMGAPASQGAGAEVGGSVGTMAGAQISNKVPFGSQIGGMVGQHAGAAIDQRSQASVPQGN